MKPSSFIFPTFTVGITGSNKKIFIPIKIEYVDDYIKNIKQLFSDIEIFELYAVTGYLMIFEKRKYGTHSRYWKIYASISLQTHKILYEKGVLSEIMEKIKMQNSIDILKFGKSLVFKEYKFD